MIIDVDLSVVCEGIHRTYKYYFFFVNYSPTLSHTYREKKYTHASHNHHHCSVTPIESLRVKRKKKKQLKKDRVNVQKCRYVVMEVFHFELFFLSRLLPINGFIHVNICINRCFFFCVHAHAVDFDVLLGYSHTYRIDYEVSHSNCHIYILIVVCYVKQ
jgi:hypothetical protein